MSRLDPSMTAKKAKRMAPLWWPVEVTGKLRECRLPGFKVTITEIARVGCRMRTLVPLRTGELATLRIDDFGPWYGTLDRNGDGLVELRFEEPLHLSVLHHLVRRYHLRTAAPPSDADLHRDSARSLFG